MQLCTKITKDGGKVFYAGSLDEKNLLVFLGRTNFMKDEALVPMITDSFLQDGLTVMHYEDKTVTTIRSIDFTCIQILNKHSWLERYLGHATAKKCLKFFSHMRHLSSWKYYLLRHTNPEKLILVQVAQLRKFLKHLGNDKNVFLFTRSAGGRIASLVANEFVVKKIVCLGYPFKHPKKPEEIERVKHLATFKKPFLIFQGEQDEYGGREILEKYALSPNITIRFIETNHDFHVSEATWKEMMHEVKQFMGFF